MEKLDYKKKDKNFYMPKTSPSIVKVPKMIFIAVDGKGNPNTSKDYKEAMELLYGLSFTIKMSKMKDFKIDGYFEYVVPPLEGLWDIEKKYFDGTNITDKNKFIWTSTIRQPEFVTEKVFNWAKEELKKKKPEIDIEKAKLITYEENLSVQILYIGSYDNEIESIRKMEEYAKSEGYKSAIGDKDNYKNILRHHEIYLSDPRKGKIDKLKTVIRHPIKK